MGTIMAKYVKRQFQVGEYWLARRDGKPIWHRFRFKPGTRQTERVSLGTDDYAEAKRKLTAWYAAHGTGPMERQATLAEVLLGYYEAHGQHIASKKDVEISSRYWNDHFGDIEARLASGQEPINGFKKYLKAKGFADNYVNRVLSVGRAAMTRAYERGLMAAPPIIKGIRGAEGEAKGRPLEIWEVQHLLKGPEHLRRFILLSLGTGARPDAVFGLAWEQVDFTGGVLQLNPVGRTQTKKRRARVPMCQELRRLLMSWRPVVLPGQPLTGPVVEFRGKHILRVKNSWETARTGLADSANPYSLRHTVARWLRSQSVPVWEVAALLGHKMPGHTVTEMYATADPKHMEATKLALDQLLRSICVPSVLLSMERAKGFEPSTLTLAT
jgi:integrase